MTGTDVLVRGAATLFCAAVFATPTHSQSRSGEATTSTAVGATAQQSHDRASPQRVMSRPATPTPHKPPPPPPPPTKEQQHPTYTVLAFTVWTGGDDLRANSYVEADLHFPDGTTTTCDLRPDNDSWDNNTVHSAPPCELPAAKRLGDLKTIKIDLLYNGDSHAAANHYRSIEDAAMNFDTWDNWDVNQVRILAQNPAQHQQVCLLDVKGNPLVRMKGNNYTFRLTNAMSSC